MIHVARRIALVCLAGACTAGAGPYPAGSTFRDRPWAPEMVVVPAGAFMMGSTREETDREGRAPALAAAERPLHAVTIAAPVAMAKDDVTTEEFDRFVKATHRASVFAGCMVDERGAWKLEPGASYLRPYFPSGPDHPAVCVTWDDAVAYAAWLTGETGLPYRLPREEEWEYAARAGTATARWWGDSPVDICAYANGADRSFDQANPGDAKANRTCDDGYAGTNPVGHYPANPWGFRDMIGNAWQWLGDCYRDSYSDASPAGNCDRRVIRGGSWHNYPNVLRAATRFWLKPDNRSSSIGFRVARDLPREELGQ